MFTRKYLPMAVLAVISAGSMSLANAASDAEVAALRQEVADLKQAVQELKSAKQAAPVVVQAAATDSTAASATPPARTKDGWAVLPDGKTSARLYGFVRGDMIHDFDGTPPQVFSDIDKQPLGKTHPIHNRTQFTVKTTRLGVDLKTPTDIGDITAKVEGDFWGDQADGVTGSGFRFRQAYLTWNNWLFGHTWSPFVSLDTQPETIDFNTLPGGSLRRKPQIRYDLKLDKQDTLTVAAEDNSSSYSYPAFSTKLEHKFDNNLGLVNARAVVHEKRGVENTDKNHPEVGDHMGYGVALGGLLNITPNDKIMGQAIHMKGDGSFVYGGGTGYVINTATHQILFDSLNSGLLGFTHKWSPEYRSTIAASWVGFDQDTAYAKYAIKNSTDANKELKQVSVNLFYTPVSYLTFGGEYTYAQRHTYAGAEGLQSRLDFMARYNF